MATEIRLRHYGLEKNVIANLDSARLSPEAYLEWEKHQEVKHEYLDGETLAMAGASDAHVTIAGNLFTLLCNRVRGNPCRAYLTDMKVQIQTINRFYYPDVFVTCDQRDRQYNYFKKYPSLIVEVLSPTTEAFDRGRKFADHRHLESLQEYVLIDSEQKSVECFRRNNQGQWVLQPYVQNQVVWLASLEFSCSMDDLYEDVTFSSAFMEI